MKDNAKSRNVENDPADCTYILEWMTEAGITVDHVETRPAHVCPACRPADLHVAA